MQNQKNRKSTNATKAIISNATNNEHAITLIALIVVVILLAIISAITINAITGDESILKTAEEVTDEYNIEQGREKVESLANSIILKDSILGKTTTLASMAEDMLQESWISSTTVDETSKVITVVTEDGTYDVFYDETMGILETDGTGSSGSSSSSTAPTVTATYDKSSDTITVTAICTDKITNIDLILNGTTKSTKTTNSTEVSESFSVTETGWYKVKVATENREKQKYICKSNK